MTRVVLFLLTFIPLLSSAQYFNSSNEALYEIIRSSKDTNRTGAAIELAQRFQSMSLYDSAQIYIVKAERWLETNSSIRQQMNLAARSAIQVEFGLENVDSALVLYEQNVKLGSSLKDTGALLSAYRTLGYTYWDMGEPDMVDSTLEEAVLIGMEGKRHRRWFDLQSMRALAKAFNGEDSLARELLKPIQSASETDQNQRLKGLAFNTLGNYEWSTGNLPDAVYNYLQAAEIWNSLGHPRHEFDAVAILGNIFDEMGDFEQAAEYGQKAIDMIDEYPGHPELPTSYNTLGWIYYHIGDSTKALEAINTSERLYRTHYPYDPDVAFPIGNMGLILTQLGKYDSAIVYSREAADIFGSFDYSTGVAEAYNNIGSAYLGLNRIDSALIYLNKGLKLSLDNGDSYEERNSQKGLYHVYKALGRNAESLLAFERYTYLNDSIYSDEAKSKSNRIQQSLAEERDAAIIKSLEIESELNKARIRQQRIIGIGGIVFIIIILAFLIQIFRIWKARKKAYFKLEQKHNELEESQRLVLAQNTQIEHQKTQIEQQHSDIIDSINFASRIQHALLKPEEHINKALPPHFIYYKPRDIVSGDCYWAAHDHPYLYISAIDCTGHGVPGAMMSMLGIAFLNEIMAGHQKIEPAEILDRLREKVIKELGQENDPRTTSYREGMDMALVRLNLETNELIFAGANNPLWLIRNDEVSILKGTKQGISYSEHMEPFVQHSIELKDGDTFYIFSDGYPDQLGGPKGKKLKSTVFREFLLSIHSQDLPKQKELLDAHFEEWKGEMEQVDDVCVIGMRV